MADGTKKRCDQIQPGDIVVAGRNFAIQNHMHASVALKESGIRCIAVESCDTGFLRKSLNIGLPVIVADDPLTCVVRGSGKALEKMDKLGSIFTND